MSAELRVVFVVLAAGVAVLLLALVWLNWYARELEGRVTELRAELNEKDDWFKRTFDVLCEEFDKMNYEIKEPMGPERVPDISLPDKYQVETTLTNSQEENR